MIQKQIPGPHGLHPWMFRVLTILNHELFWKPMLFVFIDSYTCFYTGLPRPPLPVYLVQQGVWILYMIWIESVYVQAWDKGFLVALQLSWVIFLSELGIGEYNDRCQQALHVCQWGNRDVFETHLGWFWEHLKLGYLQSAADFLLTCIFCFCIAVDLCGRTKQFWHVHKSVGIGP